jgi:hypothetical protein
LKKGKNLRGKTYKTRKNYKTFFEKLQRKNFENLKNKLLITLKKIKKTFLKLKNWKKLKKT